MSQHQPVDTPLTAKSKETTTFTSTPDNDYDDNLLNNDDDDDWIDMQASATFTQGQKLATVGQDDHLVPTSSVTTTTSRGERNSSLSLNKDRLEPLPSDTLAESAASLLSLPSDYGLESSPDTTTIDTASFPLSLQVPSIDQQQQPGLDEDSIPGSATSSNSESEYSLLNPSRKNSLTGSSGFHALTPTHSHTDTSSSPAITDDQLSQGSQQDDDEDNEVERDTYQPPSIGVTSPSFSDFVQIGSDQGDNFSMSPRPSSGKQTPSPTSLSQGKARMDGNNNDNYSSHEDDDILSVTVTPPAAAVDAEGKVTETEDGKNDSDRSRGIQQVLQSVASGQGENASSPPPTTLPAINTPAFSTQSTPIPTATTTTTTRDPTQSNPPLPSTASPVDRGRYRTTVEDARSSSEGERELTGGSSTVSGMRYRGAQRQDDRNDVRSSFFSASRAMSTMPGALNLGLDADIAPQPAAVPLNDPPVDERQCRICLGGADEEDTLGRLISPCLCKGSMKYVHIECLNAWRTRSPKRESHYKCDTCKYEFSFRRTSFARYLGHPLTVFVLTIVAFALLVFAAGFAMKLLLYLMMDESQEFIYPADLSDEDDLEVMRLREDIVIFKTPESLRAVFRIDKTHMVFGSFFVSIIGFLQLFVSMWMGGGGGIFRIGGFGLGGGGRRRGGRGERQGEAGVGGVLMIVILVFGLFKSVYMTYQFVNKMSRRVLAKAEMMVLEVQA
ncbi:hypothetical protein BG015_008514 [Linnemannia schmuckeri]|uniref:RING-CH-type domain-containing protein n=1 Tax=Linnemannia schmuckeri TaxID=64567 RepID=A0A9P5VFU5_9FUNG|nr:hypothetical protein BG015_008514 [Linnemannia schmuckeri]